MLEKFTFEKKLGIDSSDKKWRGSKVMTVSFLLVLFGALLFFFGFVEIGRLVVISGIAGSFFGAALHLAAMFRIYKESRK